MFNKKARRNFRQRKDESSEEDESERVSDGVKEADASVLSLKQVNVRRGITCSSKPNSTPPHRGACTEPSPEHTPDPEKSKPQTTEDNKTPKSQTLSFLGEKSGRFYSHPLAIILTCCRVRDKASAMSQHLFPSGVAFICRQDLAVMMGEPGQVSGLHWEIMPRAPSTTL